MRSHNAGSRDSRLRFVRLPLVFSLAAIVSAVAQDCARSEPGFPAKPIRISVPYGAGGVGDLTVRLLGQKLTERTRQQVVIENRPGAGGLLSAKAVLEAPPDGYTLGLIGNGQAISMSLFKSRPYSVLTDFTFVSISARFDMLLAVNADSPIKTLQDVVTAARRNPGKLNFGAVNPGSTQNLSAHLLKQVSELDVSIIPYKTTPDLITAILRGDVDVAIDAHRFIDRDDLTVLRSGDYTSRREAVRRDVSSRQKYLEQLLEYERRSYMQSLLLRLDKMSMAHGLEARTPFLDYRLVLWAKTFAARSKVGFGWANKPLLKEEAARYFSRELVYRPKVGFGVPLALWFRQQPAFKALLADMCDQGSLVSSFFPGDVVARLVDEHSRAVRDHTEALWVLLNIHLWKYAVALAA